MISTPDLAKDESFNIRYNDTMVWTSFLLSESSVEFLTPIFAPIKWHQKLREKSLLGHRIMGSWDWVCCLYETDFGGFSLTYGKLN